MQSVKTIFKSAKTELGYYKVMINDQDTFDHFTGDGWVQHVDQLQAPTEVSEMSEEERQLRDEYEQLTGKKIGGRAKLETIKEKVEEARG